MALKNFIDVGKKNWFVERLRNDLKTHRRIGKNLTHSYLQTAKLGKPCIFHDMVGQPQGNHNICRVKESGESERQQDESSEEITENVNNSLDIGKMP